MRASSSENLTDLENLIGCRFRKKSLLREAITHKSFAHEQQKKGIAFNERMEFLGDAVLELIMSEYLFHLCTDCTEADLSRMKAYAVQESTLAKIARELNIGDHLLLGKGEELSGGREKPSLLANAVEAILAAIYLDGGYKKARTFVISHITHHIKATESRDFVYDFKTKLQEVAQSRYGVLPKYVTHNEQGPEHKKVFEVNVFVNDELIGTGTGKNKKAAEQKAAEQGLIRIRENHETDL